MNSKNNLNNNNLGQSLIITSKFFPEYCGPAVRIKNLYSNGYSNLALITGSSDFEYCKDYKVDNFNIRRVSFKSWKFFKSDIIRSLLRPIFQSIETLYTFIILCFNYKDVKLVHILGSSPVTHAGLFWCIIFNKKLVIELVNRNSLPYQKLFGLFKLFPRKKNSIIITISDELERVCVEHGYKGLVWNRPNPVDLSRFTPKNFSNKSQQIKLLNIGSFIPRKNQMLLLEMMRHLPLNYHLEIAGPLTHKDTSSDYYKSLVDFVKDKKMSDRITINVGYVNSHELMSKCDIYLLPSYGEGLGTTLLEAISLNLPIVANSDEPAFLQWIASGINGYTSDPNAKTFANSILAIENMDDTKLNLHNNSIRSLFCSNALHIKYYEIFKKLSRGGNPIDIINSVNKDR